MTRLRYLPFTILLCSGCEPFQILPPTGNGGGGNSAAPSGSGGSSPSSTAATGAPCSDAMACGPCAHCEQDQCVAEPVGTVCDVGVCDGQGFCATGGVTWSRSFGQPERSTVGQDLGVDPSGTVYLTGYYIGSTEHVLTFDSHQIGAVSADGDANAFAVALDATEGAAKWARDIGAGLDSTGQFTEALVVDPTRGGVWLGGHFAGSFGLPGWETLSSVGGNDAWIGALTTTGDGVAAWSHADGGVQQLWALAADDGGYVAGVGVNGGAIAAAGEQHVSVTGADTAFAVLLNGAEPTWVHGLQHAGVDHSEPHGVAISDGSVWMAGGYWGTGAASSDPTQTLVQSGTTQNAMLAQFDVVTGATRGLWSWGSELSHQVIGGLSAGPDGVVAAGTTSGAFALGDDVIDSAGLFVAWIDREGEVRRVTAFETAAEVVVYDIAVDGVGNAVIVGSLAGADMTLGRHTLQPADDATVGETAKSAFIAKISRSGEVLWAAASRGTDDAARGVAAVGDAIYVTGYSTAAGFAGLAPARGVHDVFVARFEP